MAINLLPRAHLTVALILLFTASLPAKSSLDRTVLLKNAESSAGLRLDVAMPRYGVAGESIRLVGTVFNYEPHPVDTIRVVIEVPERARSAYDHKKGPCYIGSLVDGRWQCIREIGTLASGEYKGWQFSFSHGIGYADVTVSLTAPGYKPEPDSGPISAALKVVSFWTKVDLALETEVSSSEVRVGDTITYRHSVKHDIGRTTANSVQLWNKIPSNVSVVSMDPHCLVTADIARCSIGTLYPGQKAEPVEIVVRAEEPGTASLLTDLHSNPGDDFLFDNHSSSFTTILPANSPPELEVSADQDVFAATKVVLAAVATDPEDDPISYLWSRKDPGPPVTMVGVTGSKLTFVAPEVASEAQMVFEIQANDGLNTSIKTIRVAVHPRPNILIPAQFDLRPGGSPVNPSPTASDSGIFVGAGVANPGEDPDNVMVRAISSDGTLKSELSLGTAPAKGQAAFLSSEVADPDSGISTLLVSGGSRPLQGFFMIGTDKLDRLDGIGGRLESSPRLYLPVAHTLDEKATTVFLFNATTAAATSIRAELFGPKGNLLYESSIALPALGSLLTDIGHLFGSDGDLGEGYVDLQSDVPLQGFGLLSNPNSFTALAARDTRPVSQFLAPHFCVGNGCQSELQILNAGDDKVQLSVQAVDDQAKVLGPFQVEIGGRELYGTDLGTLLELENQPLETSSPLTGYLEIQVQGEAKPPLLGNLTFRLGDGLAASTLPLVSEGMTETLLLHTAHSKTHQMFTGLAILNASDLEATVSVTAYNQDGQLAAKAELTLAANSRIVDLLDSTRLFGSDFEQVGGHLRVSSSAPVVVFGLFGDLETTFLSAIEAQPLAQPGQF